jgi:predicted PurR-regulated permease PerM
MSHPKTSTSNASGRKGAAKTAGAKVSTAKPAQNPIETRHVDRTASLPVAPSSDVLLPAKQDQESPPWGLTTKAIIASAILILVALVIWRFQFLLSPLALAAVIAYLTNPIVSWLRKKTEISRSSAVLIVYLVLLLVAGTASTFLGVVVAQQSVRLWESLPEFLPRLIAGIQERAESLSAIRWTFGAYVIEPGTIFDAIDWDSLIAQSRDTLQTVLGRSGLWLAGVATATLGRLGDILLIVIVSIYLAIDGPRIGEAIGEIARQPGYRQDARRLMDETVRIWDAYLRGQVILGLVIFAIVTVVLSILGVNNSLELGVLSGVLEFLPVIGPIIGAGAAVLMALVQNSNSWGMSPWLFALVVLAAMIIIQQIENAILVPRIVGDALDLHALVVMIGVLMGTSLAGLLGAVLAAPVIATIKLFGTYVWRKMLDLPPFPDPDPELATTEPAMGRFSLDRLMNWFSPKAPRA